MLARRRFANCDSWDFDLANGSTSDCNGLFCTLIKCFLHGGGVLTSGGRGLTSIIKKVYIFNR